MKAFLAAIAFAILVSVGAANFLDAGFQQPAHAAFTTEGARVDNPGSNLLGN